MQNPQFLYGTAWKENETERCVRDALEAGFRAIDTANQRKHYFEAGVGAALNTSGIPREELFLQTKFTFQRSQDERLPYDPKASITAQVKQSFASSLEHLHTDYLDSYILHGPSQFNVPTLSEDDWQAWRAMEEIQATGKIRHLGVSNVNLAQLRALCDGAKQKPKFAQIRCYAKNTWEKEIRDYCSKQGVVFQGFSLLTANRELWQHPRLLMIADRLQATSSQVIFAFAQQIGMLPLTGTKDKTHMLEDLKALAMNLSSSEIELIEKIGII